VIDLKLAGSRHPLNFGLQDAFNLGWKLALACQGRGSRA